MRNKQASVLTSLILDFTKAVNRLDNSILIHKVITYGFFSDFDLTS